MKAMRRFCGRFWEKLSWVTIFVFVLSIVGAGVGWTAYTGNKAVVVGGRATYDIYDEDDMSSNDAYGVATQQSIKTFVAGVTSVGWSSNVGFNIDPTAGNIFLIDMSLGSSSAGAGDGVNVMAKAAAGATVVLPTTITSAMNGRQLVIIFSDPKSSAGTTNMVLWAGADSTSGVSIEDATGVTNDAYDVDAEGDSITLMPDYTNQIYRVIGSEVN